MTLIWSLQDIANLVLILIINMIGSYSHEFWLISTGQTSKINITKVILSSTSMAIIMLSCSDWIVEHTSAKLFMGLNFLTGVLSYEITTKIQTLEGFLNLIDDLRRVHDFRKAVVMDQKQMDAPYPTYPTPMYNNPAYNPYNQPNQMVNPNVPIRREYIPPAAQQPGVASNQQQGSLPANQAPH